MAKQNEQDAQRAVELSEHETQAASLRERMAALDLSKYDYENLKGKSFREYVMMVQGLQQRQLYDFVIVNVRALTRVRYEGVPESPKDIVGIELVGNKPIKELARVTTETALEFNGRFVMHNNEDGEFKFAELIGGQFTAIPQPGQVMSYYLLKKTPTND